MSEFNFFIAGVLVFLVALGWGYFLSILIISPQKKLEETLMLLSKDIIHELNIPLATIHANTSMLSKTLKDKKSIRRLKRIENASFRLEKLYRELVYTLHKEMHTIEKETFNIKPLIEERIRFFEEQHRNPFILTMNDYTILADKIGFEQVLDNIMSNAMKYSSKESPISLLLNNNILSIKDEGIGMSSSELLRIYERYFQVDTHKEGQGIGLALVHRYCENQNITIRITSEKGLGTEVFLNLEKIWE
ncbi:Two-component system histidine kinase DccS [hydrothermal vent metagenome]|uniref:histidine kinase n=1 Tax=hydrothermal vent metagenome TaxID=652676 RepID=A0A1W1CSB0_9ZZZZ